MWSVVEEKENDAQVSCNRPTNFQSLPRGEDGNKDEKW